MEEDEEDLYSEMQLEEGRRRSINSHNTLKVHTAHLILEWPEVEGWRGRFASRATYRGTRSLSHRLYNQAPSWLCLAELPCLVFRLLLDPPPLQRCISQSRLSPREWLCVHRMLKSYKC